VHHFSLYADESLQVGPEAGTPLATAVTKAKSLPDSNMLQRHSVYPLGTRGKSRQQTDGLLLL